MDRCPAASFALGEASIRFIIFSSPSFSKYFRQRILRISRRTAKPARQTLAATPTATLNYAFAPRWQPMRGLAIHRTNCGNNACYQSSLQALGFVRSNTDEKLDALRSVCRCRARMCIASTFRSRGFRTRIAGLLGRIADTSRRPARRRRNADGRQRPLPRRSASAARHESLESVARRLGDRLGFADARAGSSAIRSGLRSQRPRLVGRF